MVETKLRSDQPSSMTERISKRLQPSCGDADEQITKGSGPTRTVTAIHHGGTARTHGETNKGEGNISGGRR